VRHVWREVRARRTLRGAKRRRPRGAGCHGEHTQRGCGRASGAREGTRQTQQAGCAATNPSGGDGGRAARSSRHHGERAVILRGGGERDHPAGLGGVQGPARERGSERTRQSARSTRKRKPKRATGMVTRQRGGHATDARVEQGLEVAAAGRQGNDEGASASGDAGTATRVGNALKGEGIGEEARNRRRAGRQLQRGARHGAETR